MKRLIHDEQPCGTLGSAAMADPATSRSAGEGLMPASK